MVKDKSCGCISCSQSVAYLSCTAEKKKQEEKNKYHHHHCGSKKKKQWLLLLLTGWTAAAEAAEGKHSYSFAEEEKSCAVRKGAAPSAYLSILLEHPPITAHTVEAAVQEDEWAMTLFS